jgi:hypothetical protein
MSEAAPAERLKPRERRQARTEHLDRMALAWVALIVVILVAGAFFLFETRATVTWVDEWAWVLGRRGNDAGTFLRPHNGHLSLVPIAIYRVLFATAGLEHYGPYRALVIGAHLACVVLVFVYASRRVGGYLALLAATLVLFLGPGFMDILFPFQVAWLISLGTGVGAFLMLDRRDRVGDVGASGLLLVSLASSGLGQPIALGLAVDVLWGRRRIRDAWIVAAPLAAYAVWWLAYQTDQTGPWRQDLPLTPGFVAEAAAAAISALVGLAARPYEYGGSTLSAWGPVLLICVVAASGWRIARLRSVPPRVMALLAIVLSFWIVTGLSRAWLGSSAALSSRYQYVGALFVVLLAVELARGVSVSSPARVVLAFAATAAVVSNVGVFRDAGQYLRGQAQRTRADLGALEIARPIVNPSYVASGLPGYPNVSLQAGPYFSAAKALGTPAATPAELATEPEDARRIADAELIHIHGLNLRPRSADDRPGIAPTVDAAMGGAVTARGGCVVFRPSGVTPAGTTHELRVTVRPPGLLLAAHEGPGAVGVRRFADGFQPVGTIAATAPATLRIRPDLATEPWHLRLAPTGPATVCRLGQTR